MLKLLYIKNYALIDSLEIEFDSGFSVITGETGAGKSIILGALSLILGQRADVKSIKTGETKCIIEGTFDVSAYNLEAFCQESGIDYDPKTYILRRELLSSGKSRAFINDTPVSLTDLKQLGSLLIDIHSQHQNLLLGDTKFQMQVVDIMSNISSDLKAYKDYFLDYKKLGKELDDLKEQALKSKDNEDYLRFQFETLSQMNLYEGEQEDLESELKLLTHAEDIKSGLFKIYSLLSSDGLGIVSNLKEGLNTSKSLLDLYSNAEEINQRLESAYIDLGDLASEIEKQNEDIEYNPERSAFVNERLDQIYTLQQKYRVSSVRELLDLLAEIKQKLENIDSFDNNIEEAEKKFRIAEEKMLIFGEKLSVKRKKSSLDIEKQLIKKIAFLGMPNVSFKCQFSRKTAPDITGLDDLNFLFSANQNSSLQPIVEVASGGEISRVMLCLKSLIAGATALPTIIFDEIDTGVSGEVADKMGQVMQDFGSQMQVIAITHLPQIAAKGKTHYFVYKENKEGTTSTNLKKLSNNERISELAQMLSGSKITEAAIENAKVMLGNL